MEEIEAFAFLAALLHDVNQLFVLLADARQILLADVVSGSRLTGYRLNRQLVKAFVRDGQHVIGKVQIFAGKCAADIIILVLAALRNQLLELWNNDIIAAAAACGRAHLIVDALSTVQRQHAVVHVLVDIINLFVIQHQAVGRDGEAELLVLFFFQRTRICHRLFHGIPSHERLTTEKVYLDISASAGLLNDKVNRLLCHIKVHGHALAHAKIAGLCKAVLTAQIAVMRHMQTQRLDRCTGRNRCRNVDILIIRKQITALLQLIQLVIRFLQLLLGKSVG